MLTLLCLLSSVLKAIKIVKLYEWTGWKITLSLSLSLSPSLSFGGAKLWNSLPSVIKNVDSFKPFKFLLPSLIFNCLLYICIIC